MPTRPMKVPQSSIATSPVSGCTARITAVGLATDRDKAALADGAVDRDAILTQRDGAHEPAAVMSSTKADWQSWPELAIAAGTTCTARAGRW